MYMCMATLERRVQVLFDPAQYEKLERLASEEGTSVAAIVREAVGQRLSARRPDRRAALDRLVARNAATPAMTLDEWRRAKDQPGRVFLDQIA
jgi:hypothetical protein